MGSVLTLIIILGDQRTLIVETRNFWDDPMDFFGLIMPIKDQFKGKLRDISILGDDLGFVLTPIFGQLITLGYYLRIVLTSIIILIDKIVILVKTRSSWDIPMDFLIFAQLGQLVSNFWPKNGQKSDF